MKQYLQQNQVLLQQCFKNFQVSRLDNSFPYNHNIFLSHSNQENKKKMKKIKNWNLSILFSMPKKNYRNFYCNNKKKNTRKEKKSIY